LKKTIYILIFILVLIFTYVILRKYYYFIQDDLIFFNSYNYSKKQNEKTRKYKIKISKGEQSYLVKNLWATIDKKTFINEKIAPGTKGNFEIILTSNATLQYRIILKSKNQKPKNLVYKIKEGEVGSISEGEKKIIHVFWEWKYETSFKENKQDTIDGENLKKYNFEICIFGE